MMGFNLQLGDALRSESVTAIDDAIRAIARQEIDRTPRTKFCDACAYMHQPEISARCCCVACHGDDVPAWAQRMNTPLSSEKTGDASPASEVKACPFCGGRARLISHESPEVTNYGYEVNCDECAAQGPSTDCEWDGNAEYAKRDAIAAWNTRHSPSSGVDVDVASRAIDNAILLASVYDGVAIDKDKVIADLAALHRALTRETGGA